MSWMWTNAQHMASEPDEVLNIRHHSRHIVENGLTTLLALWLLLRS